MSHFVRCDRCSIESAVMGTVTMPPGWLKVFSADLCERCCEVVRDFIRFRPSDAAALPVEPIPTEAQPAPEPSKDGDKLFETTPEVSSAMEQTLAKVVEQVNSGALDTPGVKCTAEFNPATEANAEERSRARKAKRKAMRSPAIPDPRKPTDPPAGVQP